jgi:DNA polymerase III subunit epsilon
MGLPTKLAFLDIETTGGSLRSDRIIEIGILRVENNKLKKKVNFLIDTEVYLPREITRLTGITESMLRDAPTFSQIKEAILETIDGCTLVAHNASFDYGFLKNELKRFGTSFTAKRICTVKLSRSLYPEFKTHNLDSIISRFNLSCNGRHRALGDARVLWDFYNIVCKSFPEEKLLEAINFNLRRPNVPLNINPKILEDLPEEPGVYIFHGNDMPLYVGKSRNIRRRVLSHFSNNHHSTTEMKILQQTTNIETIVTTGELSALLLESELVKKMQPLFNRKLRKSREITVLKLADPHNSYHTLSIEIASDIAPEEINKVVTVFKNKKQAVDYLRNLARNNSLCEKLLGLEKTSGRKKSCFAHQLGRCNGACIGKEHFLKYNMRLVQAISTKRIKPWPFSGPILIREEALSSNDSTGFLINKWCFLGRLNEKEGLESEDLHTSTFDMDTYRILHSYLTDDANTKYIKEISEKEFARQIA